MTFRPIQGSLILGMLAGGPGCAPVTTGDIVGQPLTKGERREAYQAVLAELPDILRRRNPVLRLVVCLDRGIYARPFGAHVEDHDAGWLDRLVSDNLAQAITDHSPAGCPEQSYWITLANTELLPGDTVAVPLTVQRIARRGGGKADRRPWRAIVLEDGGWRFVRWE